jgi:hypothetical protein
MGVADEGGYFFYAGVAPYVYLVLRVAVSAYHFVHVTTESQIADL